VSTSRKLPFPTENRPNPNTEEPDEGEAVAYVGNVGSSVYEGRLHAPPEGRMGRDRYGDVQRMVGRGTKRNHLQMTNVYLFLTAFFISPQLDLNNNLDIREPSVHTQTRTWVTAMGHRLCSRVSRERPECYRRLKRACVSSLLQRFIFHSHALQSKGDIALLRNANLHDRTHSIIHRSPHY
jgi:hypothetical protein